MKNQNIGLVKIKRFLDKLLKVQEKNIILIVLIVNIRYIPRYTALLMEIGVFIAINTVYVIIFNANFAI